MLRSMAVVLIGTLLGALVVALSEVAAQIFFPPPADVDPYHPDGVAAIWVLACVLEAWFSGVLIGGAVAGLLARSRVGLHAVIPGVLLSAGGIARLVSFAYPVWFILGAGLAFPAGIAGAVLLAMRVRATKDK